MSGNAGMRRYTTLRPISPQRETELRESGLLVPGSTFARKGVHRLPEKPTTRHPIPTGPDQATVVLVLKRGLREVPGLGLVPCCEVCGEPVFGARAIDWSVHHCKPRDGARTDNSVANLLLCHGVSNVDSCHGRIHREGAWALTVGFKVSRHDKRDPAAIARCIWGESRWVLLGADGSYAGSWREV